MPPTGERLNPVHKHNFVLELEGVATASFREVTGLERAYNVIEYAEGGSAVSTRKFQGQGRVGNIVLKRGVTTQPYSAIDWLRRAGLEGTPLPRKTGSIVLLDDRGQEVLRWNFTGAWPMSWKGPELDSSGQRELAIEEVVLAIETLELPEDLQRGEGSGSA